MRFLIRNRAQSQAFAFYLIAFIVLLLTNSGCATQLITGNPTTTGGTGTYVNVLAPPQAPVGMPASLNMGMPDGSTSVTSLVGPQQATHIKRFTLVAETAHLTLSSGFQTDAWTFNGTSPGPTLHVQQGDLVIVTLINHLSFGVTIHWHGIDVPNAEDGVAGVTQNVVEPGQSFVYRFVTNDPGTYWYHSHQFSETETDGGLYGMILVDPAKITVRADVDYSVALHEWNGNNNQLVLALNGTVGVLNTAARPGQWVRLRIVNTSSTISSNPQLMTLVGAPFKVIALDGHDLNGPQWLNETPLPLGAAQRYDLFFQMPSSGSVALLTGDDNDPPHYQQTPALVFGQGTVPSTLPAVKQWFDLTSYGQPTRATITPQSHFDGTYRITLDNQVGNSLGRMGMTYTLNGKVFPDTGMIMVNEGQVIKIHFDNRSDLYHPMHLHGHVFEVLAHNGHPLTGSPVYLDTILVPPHTTYDIAFVANNPGLWMLHCHNLLHANWGMDMMVMYNNISTPYTVGKASGNIPD